MAKSKMENITTVLLDVDNTIIDFRTCSKEALSNACGDLKITYDERFFKTFHEVNNRLWAGVEDGILVRQDVYDRRFGEIFGILGIDSDAKEAERLFRYYLCFAADHVEGAARLVDYLSSKYKVYVASNSTLGQQEIRLKRAGFFDKLSGLFISGDIGAPKPQPAFFEEVFRRLGDPPKNSVVLIGDSLTADVKGGAEFGIKTIWFDRGVSRVTIPYEPTATVHKLIEIEDIL